MEIQHIDKPFKNSFDNLPEEDRALVESYFKGFDYRGAGYTFLANYIWRTSYCIAWEIIEGYLCMAGADCMDETRDAIIAMPLTKDGNYDPERLGKALMECKRRFDEREIPFVVAMIHSHMVPILEEALPGGLEFERERDDDEYVYLKEKLITLSGRALHKKKNHLNYFLRNFEYEVKKISPDMEDEVMALSDEIKDTKELNPAEVNSLEHEHNAIKEMISLTDEEDVYSVAIYIKGKLQAFAMGERLSENTAVEHFEKANDDFRGLYQLVCSEFCKSLPEEIEFVNREEDMGLENLRQAKEALKPDHMEEKYSAIFK